MRRSKQSRRTPRAPRVSAVQPDGLPPHAPTGWNTWDFRGFNRLVYLRAGVTEVVVRAAIWDEDHRPTDEVKNRGGLHHAFRWTDVTRLGPHAPLGLPASLEFVAGGTAFRLEASDQRGELRLTVAPLAATSKRVVFQFIAPAGEPLCVDGARLTFAGALVRSRDARPPDDYFVNTDQPFVIGRPGKPATIRVLPASAARRAAGRAPRRAPQPPMLAGGGYLADVPRAMTTAVTWNTLFDARRRLVSSPVSRDWCADWKGVAVWCWDTFMIAAMISIASPELARLNIEAVTAAIDELGMVPNYYFSHGAASKDRSMPCLGSYMIWKTQAARPDTAWLRAIYPRLATWHRWWMKHRDGNGDGLLEWGSDDKPRYQFPQLLQDNPQLQHSAKCAMYESGLDNSPMYDDVPFNEIACTLEMADVGLNSYYAMDCEALARITECLGKPRAAAAYRREYEDVRRRINERLWDEAAGIYCNRHWDGRLSRRWAPTSFFPMIAGVAPPERAERMLSAHLCNLDEFWGEWVIPSIARNDSAFPDNDYWRGRIWGPFNLLVAEGLRRYRFDDVAAQFAEKSLTLFMKNWREDGGVYENYNAVTGQGADVWNAARLYHWGGLLGFVAIQELIDVEPAGWLRIGSQFAPAASIRNVCLGDERYDVTLDDGVRAALNGRVVLACDTRACVRIPLGAQRSTAIDIRASAAGRLSLRGRLASGRAATVNGGPTLMPERTARGDDYAWSE
ncbi:MAG: Periplasmic trehalase [Phycisphaerae bacterium]|nr:Periplasmic trehalase [Phycisphaerae bacterium]